MSSPTETAMPTDIDAYKVLANEKLKGMLIVSKTVSCETYAMYLSSDGGSSSITGTAS